MAFYRAEPAMQDFLVGLIDRFADQGRPGLHEQIAVNWVRYDQANLSMGADLALPGLIRNRSIQRAL